MGLGAQPGSLKLPRPQQKSRRPLSSFSFPGCVQLRVGRVLEASQNPISGQENPETEAQRLAEGQASA